MKLYFVRHGRTEWNVEGRFQGANGDSPLLLESIKDLERLGDYLKDISFDAVFSSDLKRARETAQIITQCQSQKVNITYTESLREWGLGQLEGQKISLIESIYPKQMTAFRHNLANFKASQFEAESVYQTTHRVAEFIHTLAESSYQNILIVGHGANLTASILNLLGYEAGELRCKGGLDNASVTTLETKDCQHFKLLSWNDTSYLAEDISFAQ
ncbi:histidine phosphatase family protein [Streptococcus dentiloxodontae]